MEGNLGPARFLEENLDLLPRGRVLDVAMGSGRNAVYLARQGFEVEGVDISPEAVREALELARRYGVNIKAETADLEKSYPIREAYYDLIICFNYLQRSLMPAIRAGVRKGGMVVYETFTIDQPRFGRPHNPDFLLKYNELLDTFRDFRVLLYREGVFGGRATAGLIACNSRPQ